MEVLHLLDALEDIIEKASNLPLSTKAIVNKEELLDIIKEVRIKLPDEMKQAQWIKEERQKILIEAKKEAENIRKECDERLQKIKEERQRILAEAEKESEILRQEADRRIKAMIDESEVTKRANEQAKEIISAAQQDAKKIRLGARAYADDILAELSTKIEKVLSTISANREELKNYKS
ncbi:MAG: ATPase [Clostridiales bacterium]|nr:ATPase [Clostridiales bacterium]